ncbi:unnamed protein product [Allacma fusca]|uniref:Carboxylesterase type B domain-containing protein n=1 Tax=Allacma fusca TaxID=39272 RepID=A0A8J2LRZ8_9HEXA|nr:unnamed protein product [Allacma fusca]
MKGGSNIRCVLCFIIVVIQGNSGQVIDGSTNVVHNNVELSPVVTLAQGDLRAKVLISRAERKYYAFLGIPYASPPVHNLRFRPPSAPSPWQGVFNATEYGPKCAQFNPKTKTVEGSEDCLYLNVFVPKFNLKPSLTKIQSETDEEQVDETFPVMVFIHGGNFMTGSGAEYGGKYFMDEKVILVTLNYRLGVFGFLNAGVKEAQGNQGLKDQVLALKWVNDNIEKFGGDRHRIVIFGENAGGASVHYHLLSAASKGLFSGAISQSGTALCPWAFSRYPRRVAKRLGALMNCPDNDMLELAFCLQGKDTDDLAESQARLSQWNNHPVSPFAPSVERSFDDNDKFFTDTPYSTQVKKRESDIPWVVGVNEDEGLFEAATVLISPQLRSDLNVDWHRIAPISLYFKETALEPDAVSNQIRAFYFGSSTVDLSSRKNLSNLYADRHYIFGSRFGALLHARINQGKPVYLYYFTHRNFHSQLNQLGVGETLEATQGDELQYLFNMKTFPEIDKQGPHGNFSIKMIQLWVNFAATGTMDKTWGQKNPKWNPISPSEVKGDTGLNYYQIDDEPSILVEPFLERMNFWETLPLREFSGEDTASPYSRHDFNFDLESDYEEK